MKFERTGKITTIISSTKYILISQLKSLVDKTDSQWIFIYRVQEHIQTGVPNIRTYRPRIHGVYMLFGRSFKPRFSKPAS